MKTIEEITSTMKFHHIASRRGYISRKSAGEVETYKGRFGEGYIITDDGNVWGYFSRTIPSGASVLVTICDEGTEEIEDDVITNVVEK